MNIVVHPGTVKDLSVHRDDLFATAFLLTKFPQATILRRRATIEDLENPATAVIDQGMRHEVDKLNFDHHQIDNSLCLCSTSLVLMYLGVYETAKRYWGWLRSLEIFDTNGPDYYSFLFIRRLFQSIDHEQPVFTGSKITHTTSDLLAEMRSPLDAFMMAQFGSKDIITPNHWLHGVLLSFADNRLGSLHKIAKRSEEMAQFAKYFRFQDFGVLDLRRMSPGVNPRLDLRRWNIEYRDKEVHFILLACPEGTEILRMKKFILGLNFSLLHGLPGVIRIEERNLGVCIDAKTNPFDYIRKAISYHADFHNSV